jgi:hypothetical protein
MLCSEVGRATYRYEGHHEQWIELRMRIREIVQTRVRYGWPIVARKTDPTTTNRALPRILWSARPYVAIPVPLASARCEDCPQVGV